MIHLRRAHTWLGERLRHDRGASLVEYALLVSLIALVCFAAVEGLGGTVNDQYSEMGASLAAAP